MTTPHRAEYWAEEAAYAQAMADGYAVCKEARRVIAEIKAHTAHTDRVVARLQQSINPPLRIPSLEYES